MAESQTIASQNGTGGSGQQPAGTLGAHRSPPRGVAPWTGHKGWAARAAGWGEGGAVGRPRGLAVLSVPATARREGLGYFGDTCTSLYAAPLSPVSRTAGPRAMHVSIRTI